MKKRVTAGVLFVFVSLLVIALGRGVTAQDWRTASREPVGLAPSFTGLRAPSPPPPSATGTTVRVDGSTSKTIDLPGAGA